MRSSTLLCPLKDLDFELSETIGNEYLHRLHKVFAEQADSRLLIRKQNLFNLNFETLDSTALVVQRKRKSSEQIIVSVAN